MKLKGMVCPQCGSQLHFDNTEQEFCFCSHCGTQVFRDDKNRKYYTIRKIDDAQIEKHKAEKEVRLSELELEDRKDQREKKENMVGIVVVLVLLLIMFAFIAFLFISIENDEKERKDKETAYIEQGYISAGNYGDYTDIDYNSAVTQLETLGFTNITTIDLGDSGLFKNKKDTVESISINGDKSFYSSDYFPPDTAIIIRYH